MASYTEASATVKLAEVQEKSGFYYKLILTFPYKPEVIADIKKIKGSYFIRETKSWIIQPKAFDEVIEILKRHNIKATIKFNTQRDEFMKDFIIVKEFDAKTNEFEMSITGTVLEKLVSDALGCKREAIINRGIYLWYIHKIDFFDLVYNSIVDVSKYTIVDDRQLIGPKLNELRTNRLSPI
jgi:hypothetical protein